MSNQGDTMNAAERIEALARLLHTYGRALAESVQRSGQENDPPAIAFQRAFDFGRGTLRSAALLLNKRREHLGAITLVRGFYELAMRMLWSSREPAGWQRFQVYYVRQDKVWAEEAKAHPQFTRIAEHLCQLADPILSRTDPAGKPYDPMPGNLETVLADNEKRDVKEGELTAIGPGKPFQYTHVYRMMCRPAHGNVFPLTDEFPKPDLRHLVIGSGYATFALLRAACAVGAADEKAELESYGKQIIDTISGSRELSLDDLPEPETE